MTELLALKYRPRKLDEISGQVATRLVLSRMLAMDRVPSGLLFSGVRGTGKTSCARILAAGLNCSEETKPCGACDSCSSVHAGRHLSHLEMDGASHGSVSDMRELRSTLAYRSTSANRIITIDEAHSLSREAFDALLKILEEPPEQTYFILVTTQPNKLPVTVKSRLMQFEFRMVSRPDIETRLRQICELEQKLLKDELLSLIAKRANGSVRDAIMTLDQCFRAGISEPKHFEMMLGEPDFGPGIVRAMMTGNLAEVFDLIEAALATVGDPVRVSDALVAVLRDVLVLRAAGRPVEASPDALGGRIALAGHLDPARAFGALRLVWQLRTLTRAQENPKTALDLCAVMMTETLSGVVTKKQKEAIQKAQESAPLSLKDLEKM